MSISQDDDYTPKKLMEDLTANLTQPDKFAKIFCEAATTQKSINNLLKEIIKEVIQNDKEMTVHTKNLIREVSKEEWKGFLKKIGFGGWSLMVLIMGIIADVLIRKHIG